MELRFPECDNGCWNTLMTSTSSTYTATEEQQSAVESTRTYSFPSKQASLLQSQSNEVTVTMTIAESITVKLEGADYISFNCSIERHFWTTGGSWSNRLLQPTRFLQTRQARVTPHG